MPGKCRLSQESIDKNGNVNVNEEHTVNVYEVNVNLNVNNFGIDGNYESHVQENYDINDYLVEENVYADDNVNAYENVYADDNVNADENVNADDNMNENKNINADDEKDKEDENKQDSSDDEQGRGKDKEDFLVNDEHVIDEVSDFDSFDSDVGDDTACIRRRNLRKLRKVGGQSSVHEYMLKLFQVGVCKTKPFRAKAKGECATATTVVHFEKAMDNFKDYNRMAHEWLRKIPPKH
nr:hypothetical protein [Tanacetum cinerariifolium]